MPILLLFAATKKNPPLIASHSSFLVHLAEKCTICRKQLAAGGKYCGECAHRKGVCYICGKQILDVEFYSGHGDLETKMPSKKEIMAAKPTVTAGPKKKKDDAVLAPSPAHTPFLS